MLEKVAFEEVVIFGQSYKMKLGHNPCSYWGEGRRQRKSMCKGPEVDIYIFEDSPSEATMAGRL